MIIDYSVSQKAVQMNTNFEFARKVKEFIFAPG